MRWTQRYGVVAIAIVVLLALVLILQQKRESKENNKIYIFIYISYIEQYEDKTRQTIESLQNRISYVSRLNDEQLQELSSIKQKNIRLTRSLSSMKSCQRRLGTNITSLNSSSTTIDETINDNFIDSLHNDFHLPSSLSFLKHLYGKKDMLSPSFRRQTANVNFLRANISFIIGIPTVKRDKQSYLIETIKSLIDNLNPNDIERTLIVIFIAEPFDIEYVRTTAHELEKLYKKYIENGLIEIISPPIEFYPDFEKLKLSLNDDKQRVKWRTKQNYDFTYLMMYSSIRGKYYIQLEDDVVTKPGYIDIIEGFINRQQNQEWFMLEYSSLGNFHKCKNESL
jgi:alpha-1,3-mannosylglycoprotein beta-1,4-N-acetylglucosaminyltransferase A/B